jgi:hypothetical protein
MELTVIVTEADIKNGKVNECESCPMAIAVYRALLEYDTEMAELMPYVEGNVVHLFRALNEEPWDHEIAFSADLPVEAQDFVYAFDEFEPVKPFTTTLTFTAQED